MDQDCHIKVKVWDLPTRLFHWVLLMLFSGLWWTANNAEMQWHQILGFSLLALLSVRIIWGLLGSQTSRFSHFIHSPKAVIKYALTMKQQGIKASIGHNPLGGYMVVTLLVMLAVQVITGLYATDDIFTQGPLVSTVTNDTALWLTWLHKKTFDILLFLAGIHILAIVFHRWHGDRLLGAMFSGYKQLPKDCKQIENLQFKPSLYALGLLTIIGGGVFFLLIWPVLKFV